MPSIAFYYADQVPTRELAQFERIVVEAEHVSPHDLQTLEAYGGQAYAYISVGEAEPQRSDFSALDSAWLIGTNPAWGTRIADLSNPAYREFLLSQRFQALRQQGFRGFFLDTLDSYQRLKTEQHDWRAQQDGLVALLAEVKRRWPDSRLILNRGFEVLPRVHAQIDAVVAESLFRVWDPVDAEFREASEADSGWLKEQLLKAKGDFALDVYAIDYLPAGERQLARETAARISALGISPWVTTPAHDCLGVGSKEVIPRQVLLLHDFDNGQGVLERTAVVLDYLGFASEYRDIRKGLPQERLAGRYAGVVAWIQNPQGSDYEAWLQKQLADGVRVLHLGGLGLQLESALLDDYGLTAVDSVPPYRVVESDSLYGFESQLEQTLDPVIALQNHAPANQVHVLAQDRNAVQLAAVVTGPWGGMVLNPWLFDEDFTLQNLWLVDPFSLLNLALDLPEIPMPDVTTENGRRLWMAQIDGDGFISRAELPGTPFAAEAIRQRILKKFPYPHSVSIVEGEISKTGLYPEWSPELEAIAREIYRLPNVEAGSHSYSHPFTWEEIVAGQESGNGYNLQLPGYRYSHEREIAGSIDYIKTQLLPAGKSAELFLWTGDCLPGEEALRVVRENKLLNINGGDTVIRKAQPTITEVSPILRPVGAELQIYSPIANENVYTNLWRGPFYGYRNVLETFAMTDRPRRLKPISVYYHFYSGSKNASIRALEEVYEQSLSQGVLPIFVSDYLRRALAWQQATVARDLSGTLYYQAPSELRSLRLVGAEQIADLLASKNLSGYQQLHDGSYFSLAGGQQTRLKLGAAPAAIRLLSANGMVESWQSNGGQAVKFSMRGYRPLEFEVAAQGPCTLTAADFVQRGKQTGSGWRFVLQQQQLKEAELECR